MKFAFVIFKYFPFGGVQRDMLRIARESVRLGHEVHVYTLSWQGEMPEEGIHVHVVAAHGWLNHRRYRDFIGKVQARIDAEHFDLVVGFNRMPGLDVYFAADPCFIERAHQEREWWYRLSGRYRFFAECEKAVFSQQSACEILLLSPREQTIFQKNYGTSEERFHLVPPGISQERFQSIDTKTAREDVRKEFGFDPSDYLLLMVGSGFRTKGVDRVIEGLASLPPGLRDRTRFLVVGQDNPKLFKAQAAELGLSRQVVIHGGRNDIARLMHAADLLVHPARSELAGHVLLEAMACGLPILVSDVCGYAGHVAQAEAGELLKSPYQQSEFNSKLKRMLAADNRTQWAANGKSYMQMLMSEYQAGFEVSVLVDTASNKERRL